MKEKVYKWRCYVMRKLLVSILAVVLLLSIFSSQGFSAEQKTVPGGQYNLTEYQRITGRRISSFNEAPQLAELVKQKKLPPVGQRIPRNPAVVEPVEEIGQYGGTWRRYGHLQSETYGYITSYEPLVRFAQDGVSIEPNIAERWQVSSDGKSFTFYLRKGIRWSDGTPFTADDIMFWYEDIILNKELTPKLPTWLMIENQLGKFDKINDYTVKVSFVKPYPLFLGTLALHGAGYIPYAPKHYLKQFHPVYTDPKKLESEAKKAGFGQWYQLFGAKNDIYTNPDLPVIYAWKVVKPWGAEGLIAERNPYYWKVDPAGNQLPYIDKILVLYSSDWAAAYLRIISAEPTSEASDMQAAGANISDYTLYMENREKGKYRVIRWSDPNFATQPAIMFNQNVKDPALRNVFRNVKFRQAMSLAINRKEINDLIYFGLSRIGQATVAPISPFFEEEFEKAYVEYDPKRAGQLLDEIGLNRRDKEGWRLLPDGSRLELILETREPLPWPDVAEMVAKYWNDIGVKTAVRFQERSIFEARVSGNEHQVVTDAGNLHPLLLSSTSFNFTASSSWAPLWQIWYQTGGKSGEKPPEEVIKLIDLWEKYKTTVNVNSRNRVGKEIFRIHAENLWIISTAGRMRPFFCIVKNNFRNVVGEERKIGHQMTIEGYIHPEQCFIKK
jgi:peptide/nickel transport system substrate-binding protein